MERRTFNKLLMGVNMAWWPWPIHRAVRRPKLAPTKMWQPCAVRVEHELIDCTDDLFKCWASGHGAAQLVNCNVQPGQVPIAGEPYRFTLGYEYAGLASWAAEKFRDVDHWNRLRFQLAQGEWVLEHAMLIDSEHTHPGYYAEFWAWPDTVQWWAKG